MTHLRLGLVGWFGENGGEEREWVYYGEGDGSVGVKGRYNMAMGVWVWERV